MVGMESRTALRHARALLAGARRIVALTGAGMSTDSGIPDFRGPNGVWTKNPGAEKLTNLQTYVASREVRERAWQTRLSHPAWDAEPNAAHRALVALERTGRLDAIVTQNIDGLHEKAGSAADRVIAIHGTLFDSMCMGCGESRPMTQTLDRVRAGEADPPCLRCGGILKSATISFGQSLDPAVLARAHAAAVGCDLLLAAGTSLSVYPAAGLVDVAADAGARIVICNGSDTPYDALADAVLRGRLGDVLPALV